MKLSHFILVIWLISSANSLITQSPAWITNPNIDAGQLNIVVYGTSSTYILSPTTAPVAKNQPYNKTNFAEIPKVILSLIGFTNTPPAVPTTPFGLQITITSITQLKFYYNISTYGCSIVDWHYLYLAIQYEASTFYMDRLSLSFNASSNLGNATATQRWQTYTLINPISWNNPNFSPSNTQIIAFPTGYQIVAQSGRSYFGINATVLNSTHYTVNISTFANNILNFIDFSIITFNAGDIMANYSVFIDVMTSTMVGNSTTYAQPVITANQYLYRNCLTGAVDIIFNITSVTLTGFYYGVSTAKDDYLVWRTFNNRVRSCPVNLSYYNPSADLCQDQCAPYYYVNTTYNVCLSCAFSCYNCSQPNSSTSCTSCSTLDYRSLVNNSCICNAGFYESGSSACSICNYRCLTCSGGTQTSCLTCNSSLIRTFSNATSQCLCDSGYYQNITCLSCQSYANGCVTCSFNTSSNNFNCSACNASLFRVNGANNTKCVCLEGYYEDSNFMCQTCPLGCLSCSFNGSASICSSCNNSLNRFMSSSNLSCDCLTGYYSDSNNTCTACSSGCLACNFNGSHSICNSCNSSLNRIMGASNLTCDCDTGFYLNGNGSCSACPSGCLSCTLNGTAPVCSTCNSSLNLALDSTNTSCQCRNGFYVDSNNTCSSCTFGCLVCALVGSTPTCSSCDSSSYRIMGGSNLTCDCQQGTYESLNKTCLNCGNNCTSCILVNSSIICNTCSVGFYANGSSSCYACSLGCLSCSYNFTSSSQICSNCSSNLNFILQNYSCVCMNGTNLTGSNCSYGPNNTNTTNGTSGSNTTNNTCGNGVIQAPETCDDGNTVNYDGCSSACIVEQYHTCINNQTLYNVSLCYYSQKIELTASLIYKIPGQNSVKLQLAVNAPLCNPSYLKTYLEQAASLALFDKTRLLHEIYQPRLLSPIGWISVPTKSITYDPSTGILTIIFDYDATIDLSTKYIQFIPSTSTNSTGIKYFYASPSVKLSLTSPYNHLSTTYIGSSDMQAVQNIKYLFLVLVIFYWIFLVITLIRSKGVIGTESMLVLQMTYLVLMDQPIIAEAWSGLQLTGKYTLGFNPIIVTQVYQSGLYALEVDANILNIVTLTLAFISILFLVVAGYKIYDWIEKKDLVKKIMEIDQSQENNSIKNHTTEIKTISKIMVYIIDILISLLLLVITMVMIQAIFTNSLNLVNNMMAIAIFSIISIIFWIFYYRSRDLYAFTNTSYLRMVINVNKTEFHQAIKFIITNYHTIMFVLLILTGLMIAALRSIGVVVCVMIIIGSACVIIFHSKFNIYLQLLDSRRCIMNSCTLILLMIISMFSNIFSARLGVGLSVVALSFCLLFLLLVANSVIFVILEKKKIKIEKQKQIHEVQMKEMDNQLAMANISFIGGLQNGYRSLNKSRDYTKDKDFLNSFEFSSTRRKMLLDENQSKLVIMIEDKIKELKDFKKNIQAQLDSSQSRNGENAQNSDGNATIENVLGELNLTKIDIEGTDLEAL